MGLVILLIIVAYVAIAVVIVRSIKTTRWRLLAVIAVILVPTADAIVGRLYLRHLCATEGGLKVNRVVENVEGFLIEGATDGHLVKAYGYRFVEGRRAGSSNVDRFELVDGGLKIFTNVPPKSMFRRRLIVEDQRALFPRVRDMVEAIQSGEILAENTQISFSGGWAERFLGKFADAGPGSVAWCDVPMEYHRAIVASLKPTRD